MPARTGLTRRALSSLWGEQHQGRFALPPEPSRRHLRRWRSCLASYLGAALILAGILSAIQAPAPAAKPVRLGHVELSSTSGPPPTWVTETIPSLGPLSSISCSGSTNCVAVGQTTGGNGAVIETDDSGLIWVSDSLPSGTPPLNFVSCSGPGACVAVGGDSSSPSTGGIYLQTSVEGSFASETEPSGDGDVLGVSCPTSSYCAAVAYNISQGSFEDVLASTNGGSTWSVAAGGLTSEGAFVNLDSIQCFNASTCVATGTGVACQSQGTTTVARSMGPPRVHNDRLA